MNPEIDELIENCHSLRAYENDGVYGPFDRKFELIIQKLRNLRENEFIVFNGFNCNELGYRSDNGPCSGWNGKAKRCKCGNRRVDWEYDEDWDKVYAEAW